MGVACIPGSSALGHCSNLRSACIQVRRAVFADRYNQVDTQSLSAPTPKVRRSRGREQVVQNVITTNSNQASLAARGTGKRSQVHRRHQSKALFLTRKAT